MQPSRWFVICFNTPTRLRDTKSAWPSPFARCPQSTTVLLLPLLNESRGTFNSLLLNTLHTQALNRDDQSGIGIPRIVCADGGLGAYRSLYDACQTLVLRRGLTRRTFSGMWSSLQAMLLLLSAEIIQGLDATVTAITVFTRSTRLLRVAASLMAVIGLLTGVFILDERPIRLAEGRTHTAASPLARHLHRNVAQVRSMDSVETRQETEESEVRRATKGGKGWHVHSFADADKIRNWKQRCRRRASGAQAARLADAAQDVAGGCVQE